MRDLLACPLPAACHNTLHVPAGVAALRDGTAIDADPVLSIQADSLDVGKGGLRSQVGHGSRITRPDQLS